MTQEQLHPSNNHKRWYAVFVRARYEKAVASQFDQKGLEVFLPLYKVSRLWGSRRAEVSLPLFPGYVFSRFDIMDQRIDVLRTSGVMTIVGTAHVATPIGDHEIEAIQRVAASGIAATPWPYLEAGQSVKVQSGALAGIEGVLVRSKSECRLVISVQMLQRSVAIEIESDCVGMQKQRTGKGQSCSGAALNLPAPEPCQFGANI
jgi:transcription antitermination factor NusG